MLHGQVLSSDPSSTDQRTGSTDFVVFNQSVILTPSLIIKERSIGQRFRRSKKNVGLTEEDIVYLKHNTRYDENEIREWYR